MKTGNVEIVLPQKEQLVICCSRVAVMKNGEFILEEEYAESKVNLNILNTAEQLEKAAERIESYVKSGFIIETDEEGVARLEDLEEGVYLLNGIVSESKGDQKMLPTLLYLPSWDEAEEKMLYDITVIPKYGIEPPDTGDKANAVGFTVLLLASALVLTQKIKKNVKKEECF